LITALDILGSEPVSELNKIGFQIKMVDPRPDQHFKLNQMVLLVFLVAVEEKNKKKKMKIKCR
jgi:hypothetical protein